LLKINSYEGELFFFGTIGGRLLAHVACDVFRKSLSQEIIMPQFLTRKNPFMSLWLSGVNRVAGRGRGLWQAAARKQQTAILNDATKVAASFWRIALKNPHLAKQTKTKR
jgi:hypothetical protein